MPLDTDRRESSGSECKTEASCTAGLAGAVSLMRASSLASSVCGCSMTAGTGSGSSSTFSGDSSSSLSQLAGGDDAFISRAGAAKRDVLDGLVSRVR